MSERERLTQRAARAIRIEYGENPITSRDQRDAAETVVDELLPQVTDSDQLQGLPVGTIVVGRTGVGFVRVPGSMQPWRGAHGGYGNSSGDVAETMQRMFRHEGPLTVVWLP